MLVTLLIVKVSAESCSTFLSPSKNKIAELQHGEAPRFAKSISHQFFKLPVNTTWLTEQLVNASAPILLMVSGMVTFLKNRDYQRHYLKFVLPSYRYMCQEY